MLSNPETGGASGSIGQRLRSIHGIPVGVVCGIVAILCWSVWPSLRPARPVRVVQAVFDRVEEPSDTAAASARDRRPTVQAAGWLEAEPFITAVPALADGVIETVAVLEGDMVQTGDIVATLVDEDARLAVERARAVLASAQAGVELAEAELRAAKSDWDEPVELRRRVSTSVASLAGAEGELARLPYLIESASATLVRYEEELRRAEQARDRQAATELEVVIARQRVGAQRADVEALRAQEPVLAAKVAFARAEAEAAQQALSLRVADRLRVSAARAGLASAEAERERARAALAEAELTLERMTVRAPVGGFVQRRFKSPGDKAVRMMDAPDSAQIVHLYDPSRLQVRVDVPLADASHVAVGQECEVIVEILPETVFRGRVLRITHEADVQKNTLQVKVGIENPSAMLRPEMLTRVRFVGTGGGGSAGRSGADPVDSRVRVPRHALDSSGDTARVWEVVRREALRGTVRPVPVSVVDEEAGWARVSGDLRPGALLVAEPEGLRPGGAVSIIGEARVIEREGSR